MAATRTRVRVAGRAAPAPGDRGPDRGVDPVGGQQLGRPAQGGGVEAQAAGEPGAGRAVARWASSSAASAVGEAEVEGGRGEGRGRARGGGARSALMAATSVGSRMPRSSRRARHRSARVAPSVRPRSAATSAPVKPRAASRRAARRSGAELREGGVELGVALGPQGGPLGGLGLVAHEEARQEAGEGAPRRPRSIAALAAIR